MRFAESGAPAEKEAWRAAVSSCTVTSMGFRRSAADKWLATIYPRRCALCETLCDGAGSCMDLCEGCAEDLPVNDTKCLICGQPLSKIEIACGNCQKKRPPVDMTVAPYHYRFPADQLILQLKFGRKLCCANVMAELIVRQSRSELSDLDLIVPVPLHAIRHFRRSFNQAEEIARCLARRMDVPIDSGRLRRCRRTREQSRLSRAERGANVAGAFRVLRPLASNPHVGLVDDVITTGATIGAAARQLFAAGAGRVTAIAFARAG